MKNQTVVIILKGDGEYDSYIEHPTDVYIVPRKNFEVDMAYNKYLYEVVKKNFPETEVEWKVWKNPTGNIYNEGMFYPKRIMIKQLKIIKKFLENHDIHTFLKNECKAKPVQYFKTFLV